MKMIAVTPQEAHAIPQGIREMKIRKAMYYVMKKENKHYKILLHGNLLHTIIPLYSPIFT